MPLSITNNVSALNSQHNLGRSSGALNKSLERLSSGLKINRGADGPAALVISEKQRAQIAGLNQAIENSEKAVSMVQTAEGALTEINSLLVKVRSLAIDSANAGVNDADALAANQAEIDNALDTINRIANNTQFGTKKLLDGTLSSGKILNAGVSSFKQSGLTNGNYGVSLTAATKFSVAEATSDGEATGLTNAANAAGMTSGSTFDSNTTASIIDGSGNVLASVNVTAGSNVGAAVSALQTASDNSNVGVNISFATGGTFTVAAQDHGSYADGYDIRLTNGATTYDTTSATPTAAAGGALTGTLATEAGGLTLLGNRGNTFQNAAGTVSITMTDAVMAAGLTAANAVEAQDGAVFQIGANKDQTAGISIDAATASDLGRVGSNTLAELITGGNLTVSGGQAQNALEVIDQAINDVTSLRGDLGAFQGNTLESTANNLRATLENTVNAESVIRDTDFAMEITEMTKQQVLVQAGTSVLSTANQNPQLVLSLLQ